MSFTVVKISSTCHLYIQFYIFVRSSVPYVIPPICSYTCNSSRQFRPGIVDYALTAA
jgi:hypothetical protein